MIHSRAKTAAAEPVAEPVRFNAPLFRELVQHLDIEKRCVVLDLGVVRAQTVRTFGRFRCRLDVADLIDGIDSLTGVTDPDDLADIAEALLPVPHAEAADAVLCWDILNYLDRPAISALMSRVVARARPGTLVHALIVYSATHMPERPCHFLPQEDHSLLDVAVDRQARAAPRYAPVDLTDCMPGCKMERAMLLSNGMQEMLFRV